MGQGQQFLVEFVLKTDEQVAFGGQGHGPGDGRGRHIEGFCDFPVGFPV